MDNAFALLAVARAYRVSEIWRPRDPEDQGAGHRGRAQRAALTAAYHAGITGSAGGTVAFGWIRTAPGLRHLTVIEEAHRLLRPPGAGPGGAGGAAGHAVELFAGLLAEVRAYGEGLVIAEQIPARLVPDVIKEQVITVKTDLHSSD